MCWTSFHRFLRDPSKDTVLAGHVCCFLTIGIHITSLCSWTLWRTEDTLFLFFSQVSIPWRTSAGNWMPRNKPSVPLRKTFSGLQKGMGRDSRCKESSRIYSRALSMQFANDHLCTSQQKDGTGSFSLASHLSENKGTPWNPCTFGVLPRKGTQHSPGAEVERLRRTNDALCQQACVHRRC